MDYSQYTSVQLMERINELEMLNSELLSEKEQDNKLEFAWSGNLGHWYWNIKSNSVVCNKLKVTTLGYSVEEMPQKINRQFFTEKLHPDDYQSTMNAMINHLQGKVSIYETEYRIQAKDKSWKWYYDRGKITQRDANGKPTFVAGIVFDITEKKEKEFNLKKQNEDIYNELLYIDELTGGSNKNSFLIKANMLIMNNVNKYAFILLDINKFKFINEHFGNEQGDLLLKHIAKVLSKHIDLDEVFARIAGDKFYILHKYITKDDIEDYVKRITEDILSFKFSDDSHYNIVVCAGIFIIENTAISIDIIIDRASIAAKVIKGGYTSAHCFYTNDIHNTIMVEKNIEDEMYYALENGEFEVYIQPKYNFVTNKIAGAEALIRWNHPQKGLLPPDLFIPIFEKNGFITKIDMYVFEEICKKQKLWAAEGKEVLIVSVNQSRVHLDNPDYVNTLRLIVEKYNISPEVMELELTESVFTSNMDLMFNITRQLHNIGFRLSIDDFGSGYSSFNMLKDIVVDVLKIDREFFIEPSSTVRGRKIVKSIIMMAKDLGIETVAEGVETKEQVDFLIEMGCDLAQGYYFAKPMPMSDFEDLLIQESKAK